MSVAARLRSLTCDEEHRTRLPRIVRDARFGVKRDRTARPITGVGQLL